MLRVLLGSACSAKSPRQARRLRMSAVAELKPASIHKELYEIGEIPPLGHVPAKMHAWAIRKDRHGPPREVDADRSGADLDASASDDVLVLVMAARRQLQRRVGRPRHADFAARRPQEPLSHRRLRRVGHRLGGGLQGEALESRRRSRRPLQSGRRRRRGMQWRRSDVLAVAAHLGLRDAGRFVRAVLPRAGSRQLMDGRSI